MKLSRHSAGEIPIFCLNFEEKYGYEEKPHCCAISLSEIVVVVIKVCECSIRNFKIYSVGVTFVTSKNFLQKYDLL